MTTRRPSRLGWILAFLLVGVVLASNGTVAATNSRAVPGVEGTLATVSQPSLRANSTAGPALIAGLLGSDRTPPVGGSPSDGPGFLRSLKTASETPTEVVSVPVGDDPGSVTYDGGNGWVYVTNGGSDNVSVIDGTTVVGTVNVGTDPEYASYDSADGYVYVPNFGSDNVSVLSGTTLVATIPAGSGPAFSIFDGQAGYEYVANSLSENLSVISGSRLIGSVLLDSFPTAETYDSGNGDIYVSNSSPNNVSVVNGLSLVANVTVGRETAQGTYDTDNGYVYIPNEGGGLGGVVGNTVSVIHGTSLVGPINVGNNPDQASFDGANGFVYAPNLHSKNVSVISGQTVVGSVNVGTEPNAAVYDGQNGDVYVPNIYSDNVSIINGTGLVGTENVGTDPEFAAADTGNGYVYISNLGSNNVSVIVPPRALFHVTFVTDPSSCSLSFAGRTYSSGATNSSVPTGTYSIVAVGCTGETFSSWTSTVGTVLSPSDASTTVDVTANGTLTASYTTTPPASYNVSFATAPGRCTISFDDRTYANGSTNSTVPAGTYPVTANSCSGETFLSWTSTVGTLGSSFEASTSVTVTANGTLTASYVPTPPPVYQVAFVTSPTECTISFEGRTYASGSTNSSVPAGTYPIVANGCSGESFSSWTSTVGAVGASSEAATTVMVTSSGTLTASYTSTPPTVYRVSFETEPTQCTISLLGLPYVDGSTNSSVPAGTYPIVANACSGETFKAWTSTAGSVKSPSSSTTTINITSSGTLTATYAASVSSHPAPSKGSSGFSSLDYGLVIGVPIAVAAVALTIILIRRRRRAVKPPADPSSEPPDAPSPPAP